MRYEFQKLEGFLVLDKPRGITSNDVVQRVKKAFGFKKVGHTGTLDPLATGVMVLCIGAATKFSRFVVEGKKKYRVSIRLGVSTDTFDSDGEVVSNKSTDGVTQDLVKGTLELFRGKINQVPPMYSAIKKNGVPLYKMARQGIKLEIDAREVSIYENKFLGLSNDLLELDIVCSRGTYIRTIAADLGDVLGCGAHVVGLRRLAVEPYGVGHLVSLEELESVEDSKILAEYLLPISSAFACWMEIDLSEEQSQLLRHGVRIELPELGRPGEVSLYKKTLEGRRSFIGVGEVLENGFLRSKRMTATSLD